MASERGVEVTIDLVVEQQREFADSLDRFGVIELLLVEVPAMDDWQHEQLVALVS